MKYILGIESSCDETAAAVVAAGDDGKLSVLSDIVASQVDIHRLYGGVVPEIASRAHTEAISGITYKALETAGITPAGLDAVAVTTHPGLIGALLVGVSFAKAFAFANRIPLYGIDHMKGHIAASFLTEDPPKPPFLALAVSGGHTALYLVNSYTDYVRIGTTRDDAIGEAFDKIGRLIGIPYPAGAGFDALAGQGFLAATGAGTPEEAFAAFGKSPLRKNPLYRLPSPAVPDDSLDFSYSGLKTAAVNILHRVEQAGENGPAFDRALFAAAYTYEAVSAVVKKTAAAFDRTGVGALAVSGGVAANSHLRGALAALCRKKKKKLHIPPPSLCGDNAAMIAAQGYYALLSAAPDGPALNASAADDGE